MNANHIQLPWGKESLTADLPRGWRLGDVLEPVALPGAPNSLDEAQRALAEPVGMPRLRQLARSGIKIALVIDDDSRPTSVASLFPAVAAELQAGGASLQQVTLVPALGVHRGMSADEVARRLGEDWLSKIAWHNPGGDDPEEMVFIGATSRGTPVWVDKTVAEADLIVSIGCIEPHIIASFGGGYKNLIPGVAGRATIAHNHALNCCPDTFNMVGQPIERNPMRLDLEEAGGMILGKVFIINAVLNSQLQVVRVVCGDPLQAHRAGTEISAGIYGVQVPKLADVVITDSNPMNSDLRQGVKALANTIRAVRPGGAMITCIQAQEGVGVFGLANRKLPVGKGALKLLAPLLLPAVPKLKLKGMGEEDKFFLYFALQAMRRASLYVYAPTIPAEIHPNLPFVEFVPSLAEGIARANARVKQGEVLVFPHGGSTYPILPG